MTRKEQIKEASIDYQLSTRPMAIGGDTFADDMRQLNVNPSFIKGAEWADSHPRWISVEDELPKINPNGGEWEFSDDVIVYLKDGDIAVGRYERDNSNGEHYWVLYGVDKDLIVTHWMHLPTPPKKGDQDND